MDTIFKTFRAEVKSTDPEEGIVEMLIPMSTGAMDRDGEVIEPLSFKKTLPKFKKRPVLLSSHDYRDLRKQIGEFQTLKVTEEGLLGKPKYYINEGNEEADWAFKLASKGMAAFSVGFIPKEWEDGKDNKSPRRTYTEVELLEISQVVVPSNQEAIQGVRGKSADPVVNKLLDEVEKSDLIITSEEIANAPIVDLTEEVTNEGSATIKIDVTTKPEETPNYIRIPVPKEEGKHEGHRIRTIEIDKEKGIKALYCGEDKVVIAYLFDKEKWNMDSAKEWVKEHGKSFTEREVSQAELKDEIDYLKSIIEKTGISPEVIPDAKNLVIQILRITGSDIPEEIKQPLKELNIFEVALCLSKEFLRSK